VAEGAATTHGRLDGKVAVVTGAGTSATEEHGVGVGRAIALTFGRAGAKVVLVDRDESAAEITHAAADAEGLTSSTVVADVTSSDDCERAIATAVERYGHVDILVNNAAILAFGSAVEASQDDWNRVLAVNLTGAMLMTKFAVPAMTAAGGGAIVNISSIATARGNGLAAYAASKGGLEALTVDTAFSYGRSGVRANAVMPGSLDAPMTTQMGMHDDRIKRMRTASAPLGTVGTGWDIANAALFLASDEARWITGVTLPVDGGLLTGLPMTMLSHILAAGEES
jgi:NAD(P)-dependent dehydrogenase (short-subunit alcohol dehydrogenase family)